MALLVHKTKMGQSASRAAIASVVEWEADLNADPMDEMRRSVSNSRDCSSEVLATLDLMLTVLCTHSDVWVAGLPVGALATQLAKLVPKTCLLN